MGDEMGGRPLNTNITHKELEGQMKKEEKKSNKSCRNFGHRLIEAVETSAKTMIL